MTLRQRRAGVERDAAAPGLVDNDDMRPTDRDVAGQGPPGTSERTGADSGATVLVATVCGAPGQHYYQRKRVVFLVGAVLGLLLAVLLLRHREIDLDRLLETSDVDALFNDFRMLPTNLNKYNIFKDAILFTNQSSGLPDNKAFSIGVHLSKQGVRAKHPVIMVPGVISTGLESWSTCNCSLPYFRKRLWGSWTMLKAMVLDKECWMEQLMLDPRTGLDPPGIKLRAAQGFDAADFFVAGYWIWNKIIENLATIGYEPNNMFSAAYDWRLSYLNLEKRDRYFTKLKLFIETSVEITGEKAVVVAHSMGSQVVFWFLKWVEAENYGNGGRRWCEDHIEAFVNVAGSMLGAPKAVPAILSGEMRDTAQLNAFAVYGLEKFFSKRERALFMRRLPGMASMLPKGGDAVWGNLTWAPDDPEMNGMQLSLGQFLSFRNGSWPISEKTPVNKTVAGALDYLFTQTPLGYREFVNTNYSHGIARSKRILDENEQKPNKWINPLEARLPNAPSMRIYCLYGVGKETERGYWYTDRSHLASLVQESEIPASFKKENDSYLDVFIDSTVNSPPKTEKGVTLGNGDGTVPLLSSGYMCAKGWRMPRYNPANISVKTYEMKHEPANFDIRGGAMTADHVDILGRTELNEMILRIASGQRDLEERFVSNIKEIVDRIDISDAD